MSLIEHIAGTLVLLRGRISDALTQRGLAAQVTVELRQGADFRPLTLPLRQQSGGSFVIAARMSEIAARAQLGRAATLRLTASAPLYQTASLSTSLTAAQFARKSASITINGTPVATQSVAAAPIVMNLALKPLPVMLAGQVLSDNQLASPVSGARVRISGQGGAQIITDSHGRFRFDAPPLLLALPLSLSKGSRTATALHLTDFATPVNFITLNLPS